MRLKKSIIVAVFCSVFSNYAANPLFTNIFTADPASLVYNDQFYLYTGHDEASQTGGWFSMKEWRVFSSKDMVNWTDHGACLKLNAFTWASGDAWAGQCVYRNGKFYWYVSVLHKTKGGHAIGVAVSDSPTGPFTDAIGAALITTDMTPGTSTMDDIDPTVFIDDDGKAYMYWGNGTCKYVVLNADMKSFSGSVVNVKLQGFGEAPWLHKKDKTYYLSYSSSSPSTIEYATSSSPTGPWTYKSRILDVVKGCATSHQAIQEFRNEWYFIYHNGAAPTGGEFRRSVCIDYLYYNTDGTIKKVIQTTEGVKKSDPVSTFTPFTGAGVSKQGAFSIASAAEGVTFSLPPRWSSLDIYNINGQNIMSWTAGSGNITWKGKASNGLQMSSGQYTAVLVTDKKPLAKTFVFQK